MKFENFEKSQNFYIFMIFWLWWDPGRLGSSPRPRLACLALSVSRGPGVGLPADGWPAKLPGTPGGSPVAGGSAGTVQGAARGLPGSQKLDSANVQHFSLIKKKQNYILEI